MPPASLFSTEGLMNTAKKPALAEALWEMTGKQMPALPTSNVLYVLDGGDLPRKLQWKKGENVQQICQRFVNYRENAEVVFDGYPEELTTKDITHSKCTKGKRGKLVKFSLNTKLSMSKEKFLLNKENTQEFLRYLKEYMNSHGIKSTLTY